MNILFIIPARGGSKRLPNKNIRALGGIPLFVHSVNYAKSFSSEEDIFVSTDHYEIKRIAIDAGVNVIDRPKDISGDLASTISVVKHALGTVEKAYDTVVILQPTNPLRPKHLLTEALEIYKEGSFDSLMTVTHSKYKLGKIINQKFKPFNYSLGQRSQDIEPLYYENGLLYIIKVTEVLKGTILGKNNYPMILKHPFSRIDIDTLEDFELAEFFYKKYDDE